MNLDNIAITLRPRSGWQSIDLGFKLARRWFLPLFMLWCLLAVPVYLLCKLTGMPAWLIFFAWWWFKPLYEAPLYFWCSRAIFNEPVTFRQSLAVLPRKLLPLLRTYLGLWRLGTARSQNMNVLMVENVKGKARASRISVISRVTTRTDPLIFICVHIEAALAYSLLLTGYVLLPASVTEDALWLMVTGEADSAWFATAMEAGAVIAAGIVAPFYVCAGFSLYINRRTHLEAWDIDLYFRRIVHRQNRQRQATGLLSAAEGPATLNTQRAREASATNDRNGGPSTVAASLVTISLLIVCLLQPAGNVAAGSVTVPDDRASHQLIDEILDHRDFGLTTTEQQLQLIEKEEVADDDASVEFDWAWVNWLIAFIKKITNVAVWIEWVLWAIAAVCFAGLIYLVVRNRHHLSALRAFRGFRRTGTSKVQLFDLDIAPQSLPDDIPAMARDLLKAGQKREAMSLLYRGALSRLVHRYGMSITDSATERQCVEQVESEQPGARSEVFSAMTRYWLQVAYGRTAVSDSAVHSLCDKWRSAFESDEFDSAGTAARGAS